MPPEPHDLPPAPASRATAPYPAAGLAALLSLLARLGVATLSRGDRVAAFAAWVRGRQGRLHAGNLVLALGRRRVLLVAEPGLSAHVLDAAPTADGYIEGKLKRDAMAFLAPRALTISHGDAWYRRRAYNQQVLATGAPHPSRDAFLRHVRDAFAMPVHSIDDIRDRMRAVMLRVVAGPGAPDTLGTDVEALFEVVESPLRRLALGRFSRRRRARFYAALRRRRAEAPADTLLGRARETTAGELEPDEALEQAPHWMFTFTGSATDLLTRTLALLGSRPDARRRAVEEIRAAGPLDDPASIDRLRYLEACVLEAGRLFPPVARTFHVAPRGDAFDGHAIAPGVEVAHYFPLLTRDAARDPRAHAFDPDRWLAGAPPVPRAEAGLFLSGPRACPGRDLILFVIEAALASLLAFDDQHAYAAPLAADPVPLTFPAGALAFAP